MKTLLVVLCLLFVAFAAAQTPDGTPYPGGTSRTIKTDVADSRNGLPGYAFTFALNEQPTPPVSLDDSYDYYLQMTIFFEDESTKFFIDFNATERHIDYYVKGEHSSNSTLVLMDPRSTNPGEGKNGWIASGLQCGVFSGTVYSEVPATYVNIFFAANRTTAPDNSSLCVEDPYFFGDDSWEEEDDGVRLFLISFFSTFGILLFVFSLCLCAFACIRSCRYKCRARRCARKARKAAKAELKATTQLVPAVASPAVTETATPASEQVFAAPMYPFYPEQFPQYPQYSMLATAPQQYYSDQPQVQYVAFHPMMFPGYPAQPQNNQQ